MLRLLAAALLLLLPVPALAEGPPDGIYSYRIVHSGEGELGSQTLAVASEGTRRVFTAERSLIVERLFIVFYRETTRIEEVWQDGLLQRYHRHSDFGDEVTSLTVERQGETLQVEGGASLPGDTLSTAFWHPEIIERTQLFSSEDGRLVTVATRPAGSEELVIGGRRLTAERFEMTGAETRSLWFDAEGRLLKMQLHRKDGESVTYLLTALPE